MITNLFGEIFYGIKCAGVLVIYTANIYSVYEGVNNIFGGPCLKGRIP